MDSEEIIYKIVVPPAAEDRIAEHFDFLMKVSEDAAIKLVHGLLDDIQSLEKMPFRNPVYNRPFVTPLKYRCMVSNKRYLIVYQVVNDTVLVEDIQDCRQNNDMH